MVAKLSQTADALMHSPDDGSKVIVAIVGAGHCPGMLEKLKQRTVLYGDEESSFIGTKLDRRPEKLLPFLVETKKRTINNDEEVASLVTDIVQFDYRCVLESNN